MLFYQNAFVGVAVNGDLRRLGLGSASTVVRHLHLAFKGLETEEVYNVLMEQMVRAINPIRPVLHRQGETDRGYP